MMNVMEAMSVMLMIMVAWSALMIVSVVWSDEIGRFVYWVQDQRTFWRMGYKLRFGQRIVDTEQVMWTENGMDCMLWRDPCLLWFYWELIEKFPAGWAYAQTSIEDYEF